MLTAIASQVLQTAFVVAAPTTARTRALRTPSQLIQNAHRGDGMTAQPMAGAVVDLVILRWPYFGSDLGLLAILAIPCVKCWDNNSS